jgi:hypothetical protein
MMTPAEMVEFHLQRSMSCARTVLEAQAAGNFPLAELNARQLFKNRLMVGLLTWRLGGDPRTAITDAVAGFLAGRQILRQMDPGAKIDHLVPLESALVVAYLIDKQPEYPPDATADEEHDAYERRLDLLLAAAVRGQVDPVAVDAAVAELAARKRCKLAADSYRTYFQILGAQQGELDDLVRAAEKLYGKRARDSFYSGGEATDGGGPDNPHVVDYRLAAVLKKVGYQGESVHRWRW